MAKNHSTRNGEQPTESTVLAGAEAMKDGFEKVRNSYDQFVSFSKDNAEAMLKSANAAGKGMETINGEVFAFTRKIIEDGVAATRAVLSATTFEQAFQLQGEYSKTIFQSQVDEAAKLGELALSAARETAEPLNARLNAVADFVRAG